MKRFDPPGKEEGAPYDNGDPAEGREGDEVLWQAFDPSQREIHNLILAFGLVPDPDNYTQLTQAIERKIAATSSYDIPFLAGWGSDGTGEDLGVQSIGAVLIPRPVEISALIGHLGVTATGRALQVQITRNTRALFARPPAFAAGQATLGGGTLSVPLRLAAGDRLEAKVLRIGSSRPGQKLLLSLKGRLL